MLEPTSTPLLPRRQFYARVRHYGLIAFAALVVSLALGMAGYHLIEGMGWVDSFANAAMILSGMGPLDPIRTTAGRVFVGAYSLFSGVAFLTTVGFFLTPVVHRLLHKFHLEAGKTPRKD